MQGEAEGLPLGDSPGSRGSPGMSARLTSILHLYFVPYDCDTLINLPNLIESQLSPLKNRVIIFHVLSGKIGETMLYKVPNTLSRFSKCSAMSVWYKNSI